ncbi:MAG: hypothetical protein Roseis2KO_27810 [Roseivirga sp.]
MPESFLTFAVVQLMFAMVWLVIYRKVKKLKPKLAYLILSAHAIGYIWISIKNTSGTWIAWYAGEGANGFAYEIFSLMYLCLFTGILLLIWLIFYQRFGVRN